MVPDVVSGGMVPGVVSGGMVPGGGPVTVGVVPGVEQTPTDNDSVFGSFKLLGSALELLWLAFSRICMEQPRSLSAANVTLDILQS